MNFLFLDAGNREKLLIWGAAVALTFVIYFALSLLRRMIVNKTESRAKLTDTIIDDVVVEILKNLKRYFLFAVSAYLAFLWIKFPVRVRLIVDKAIIIILLMQAAHIAGTVINFWVRNTLGRKSEQNAEIATTINLLTVVLKGIVYTIILLLALNNLGVNITALIAGLGVGGVAVALALQNILTDLFSSLTIVLDKPFLAGDFIVVGDLMGTVEHIGLKTTRVRSLSGEQLVFGNGDLLQSRIKNFKRMAERRIVQSLTVTYQTSAERLEEIPRIIREIVEGVDLARFDRCHFLNFGSSSLDFELVYWILSPEFNDYADRAQKINLAIFRKFSDLGIDFAYPTQTLYMVNDKKDSNR